MKSFAKVLFRQRIKLEEYLIGGLGVILEFLKLLAASGRNGRGPDSADEVLGLEVAFQDRFTLFLDVLEQKYSLPFHWEDIFEVYTSLRKIFAILLSYYAERRIFKPKLTFSHFFEAEARILENLKCFLQEYLSNRKYCQELLRNNHHELKDFNQLYYQGIASMAREEARSPATLQILQQLRQINTVNASIQDLLHKILVGTNL